MTARRLPVRCRRDHSHGQRRAGCGNSGATGPGWRWTRVDGGDPAGRGVAGVGGPPPGSSAAWTGARGPTDPANRAVAVRHLAASRPSPSGRARTRTPAHPTLPLQAAWSRGAPNPDNVCTGGARSTRGGLRPPRRRGRGAQALFSLVEGDMHPRRGGRARRGRADRPGGNGGRRRGQGRRPPARHRAAGHARRHPGDRPGHRLLLIRQYLYDWAADPVASFSIRATRPRRARCAIMSPDAVAERSRPPAGWRSVTLGGSTPGQS